MKKILVLIPWVLIPVAAVWIVVAVFAWPLGTALILVGMSTVVTGLYLGSFLYLSERETPPPPPTDQELLDAIDDLWGSMPRSEIETLSPQTIEICKRVHRVVWKH